MKTYKLFLLPLMLLSLVSCGEAFPQDTDFDGLLNEIDPDPNNNEYLAKFKIPQDPDTNFTDTYSFKMDYRDFIYDNKPEYNANVCKIASMFAGEAYYNKEKAYIQNNQYENEFSSIFNLYPQFGIEAVEYAEINNKISNPYDECGLFLGYHKFYYNNKKHQIFFVTVRGYTSYNGWASNLDIGADTDEYLSVSDPAPEWTDKKMHKGFAVTAERAYPFIEDYIARNKDDSFIPYAFLCGHSRGGAITNLLAKKLTDLHSEIKTNAYCIHCPNTTTENDTTKLIAYENIFKIQCLEDLIPCVPLETWGFSSYGKTFTYSHYNKLEEYKRFFKKDYNGLTLDSIGAIVTYLEKLSENRENIYKFRAIDEENNLELEKGYSLSKATERQEELLDSISDKLGKFSVDTEIIPPEGVLNRYEIQKYTRPSIIISIATRIVTKISFVSSDELKQEITKVVFEYLPFVSRYISEISDLMSQPEMSEFAVSQISETHASISAICSAYTAQ